MKRITCIILALTLTLLCGCGSKDSGDNVQDYGNTQQEEFVVTPMASGLELEPYSCADFSMSIPQGWTVEAATSNAGMYHALRASLSKNASSRYARAGVLVVSKKK